MMRSATRKSSALYYFHQLWLLILSCLEIATAHMNAGLVLQPHHESSSSEWFEASDSVTTFSVKEDNLHSSARKLCSVRIYRCTRRGDVKYLYDCTMMEVSLLVKLLNLQLYLKEI